MDDLQLIVDNRSSEFKSLIYTKLKANALTTYVVNEEAQKQAERLYIEYFSVIDPMDAKTVLYNALLTETNENIHTQVLSIIKAYDLVDYEYCKKLLGSELIGFKKLALKVLTYNKPYYVAEDIQEIKNVIILIQTSFPSTATITSKKGFLSSNEKEVWTCTCGKTNAITDNYCTSCYKNQCGFKSDELTPDTVNKNLNNLILALEDSFDLSNLI